MGPCRIGWSCSFAVLCCDSNLPCLTCCLAGVPLLLSDLVWNRSIENTDSWKKKHQDENWVTSFWEQQKVKKFREQGREVFIRCFLSHGRWLKSMWRTLALTKNNILKYFLPLLPWWKGEKSNLQHYCAPRFPNLTPGSGQVANTTPGTLRTWFIARYRVRPTYQASFIVGAAVGKALIAKPNT